MSESRNPGKRSKIAIVGAGPAGSSLAIRLALDGFETVLIEKEKFPRQKLCGEFISPECLKHFKDLGVLDSMMSSGGARIHETRFFEQGGRSIVVPSSWFGEGNGFALGLSRAEMDLQLMERAREVGVEVLEESSVTGIVSDGTHLAGLKLKTATGHVDVPADIAVDATGRGSALARLVRVKTAAPAPRSTIVGFKSHIAGARIEGGTCEIYSFPGGYAGLSNIEGHLSNLCFMIKSDLVRDAKSDAAALIESLVKRNLRAAESLQDFHAGEWLAVAVSGFGAKHPVIAPNLYSVGDAAAFIDPFTGSGMVMAMESSAVLAEAICSSGASDVATADRYAREYGRRFARRLRLCSILRRSAFMPRLATVVVAGLSLSSPARRILARATRG